MKPFARFLLAFLLCQTLALAGITVDIVGNLKLGQFRLSFADVRAEALGLPLMLTRTYDTAKRGEAKRTQGQVSHIAFVES